MIKKPDIFTDHALEQQQILDVAIVSVVERYTVVSLTGAAGVLAPVTMLTVLELDLELDLVPALLLRVKEGLFEDTFNIVIKSFLNFT